MRTAETVSELAAFEERGAGSDAERRAAKWLQRQLSATGRDPRIEPFWCRPNWAMAHAWHAALGAAGSLASVDSPRVGGGLILLALLSTIADWLLGTSLGRRLTPERASQNVVAEARRQPQPGSSARPVKLIITANYDAGRTGVPYWNRPRAAAARLHNLTRGLTPGWLGWLVIALVWVLAAAILRLEGSKGAAIGIVQLLPTVGLVLSTALLLDIASSSFGPAAGDNGSGIAAAIALTRALDAAPPRHLAIEVVLTGAGDGSGIGLRRHLRARRRELTPAGAVILGIAACGGGSPRWWVSDGPLLPLPYFKKLRELCDTIAADEPGLEARPHRGRGSSPALPARLARLPAITIGCLDANGTAPRSHQRSDTAQAVDPKAADHAVELGLLLVDAIDGYVAASSRPTAPANSPNDD